MLGWPTTKIKYFILIAQIHFVIHFFFLAFLLQGNWRRSEEGDEGGQHIDTLC